MKIIGPVNLPATVPYHASQLYSKNIITFLVSLIRDGKIDFDSDDEIMKATLVFRDGVILHEGTPILHTPLMSGSNAISGITLVGTILSAGTQRTTLTMVLGFMAVVFATINVVRRLRRHSQNAEKVQKRGIASAR